MDEGSTRAATLLDVPAISRLHGVLFSPPWTEAGVAGLMSHAGSAAFVVDAGPEDGISGFILGRVAADEAEILSLGVAATARRQGIGRRLVVALATEVHRRGSCRLYLEVSPSNAPAVALYESLGFASLGVRRAYYRATGRPPEDARLLSLELTRPQVD